MMGMSEHDDKEKREREVRLWLEKKRIPYQRYKNLSTHFKDVLRNLVCRPTRTTSPHQRKELYTKLCLPHVGGRDSPNPVDLITSEQLQKFFSPLTPSEKLHYLEKF